MRIQCKTQTECDAALKNGNLPELVGGGYFVVSGKSYVEAWGSSHVDARGSSHVEAWGSSHVDARESSHVEAWGSSHVDARESSHVVATKFVAIHQHSKYSKISGGVVVVVESPKTPKDWCEFYGATISGTVAILFKAVREDLRSSRGFLYEVGTTPKAPDWDGGLAECGGGLHFCAHPAMAKSFDSEATRFLACPVLLEDIAVHKNPSYPSKVKAKGVCTPIYEVDYYGNRLPEEKCL